MKKRRLLRPLLCAALALLLLCGCSPKVGDVSPYEVAEIEGVALELTEISSTGGSVTVRNGTDEQIETYPWFVVEKWSDDAWHTLKPKYNDEPGPFPSCMFPLEVGEGTDVELNFDSFYYSLARGSYRVLVRVRTETELSYVPCEFSID